MAFVRTGDISLSLDGLEELQSQFDRLGRPPKSSLTKAAKAGMAGTLAEAKATAPTGKTGMLKRGVHQIQETPNKRNKAVYRINWWKKYSSFYSKKIIHKGLYGGTNATAYYPQSVEWGFKTKHGKKEGKYFVRNAIESHQTEALQKVIDVLSAEIEKLSE